MFSMKCIFKKRLYGLKRSHEVGEGKSPCVYLFRGETVLLSSELHQAFKKSNIPNLV